MQDEVKKSQLRLICSCGTIWPVCEMPMDILEVLRSIRASRCPTCDKSSKTAAVYVEKKDDARGD